MGSGLEKLIERTTGYRENPLFNRWLQSLRRRRGSLLAVQIAFSLALGILGSISYSAYSPVGYLLPLIPIACYALLFWRGLFFVIRDHRPERFRDAAILPLTVSERYWGRMLPLLLEIAPFLLVCHVITLVYWPYPGSGGESLFKILGQFEAVTATLLGGLLLAGVWLVLTEKALNAVVGYVLTLLLYPLLLSFVVTFFFWLPPVDVVLGDWPDFFTLPLTWGALILVMCPGPLIVLGLSRRRARRASRPLRAIGRCLGWYAAAALLFEVFSLAVMLAVKLPDPERPKAVSVPESAEYQGAKLAGIQGDCLLLIDYDHNVRVVGRDIAHAATTELGAAVQGADIPYQAAALTDGTVLAWGRTTLYTADTSGTVTSGAIPQPLLSSGICFWGNHPAFDADGDLLSLGGLQAGYPPPNQVLDLEFRSPPSWTVTQRLSLPPGVWSVFPVQGVSKDDMLLWMPIENSILRYHSGEWSSRKVGKRSWRAYLRNTRIDGGWKDYSNILVVAGDDDGNAYFVDLEGNFPHPQELEVSRLSLSDGRLSRYRLPSARWGRPMAAAVLEDALVIALEAGSGMEIVAVGLSEFD